MYMELEQEETYENGMVEYNEIKKYDMRMIPTMYMRHSNIHKLIYKNMNTLVPNIDYGNYKEMTIPEMEDWINCVERYIKTISSGFLENCKTERKKISQIQRQEDNAKKLDMKKIEVLPNVLKKEIFGYMCLQDQIDCYMGKYQDIYKDCSLLRLTFLRKLYTNVFYKRTERCIVTENMYIMKLYNGIRPNTFHNKDSVISKYGSGIFPKSCPSKRHYIDKLKTIMNDCASAPPLNKKVQMIYVKEALRMIKSLIYFVYYSDMGHVTKKQR